MWDNVQPSAQASAAEINCRALTCIAVAEKQKKCLLVLHCSNATGQSEFQQQMHKV